MTAVEALQQTLAAEHAAVYVLGVLGGRAAAFPRPALHDALAAAYDVHRGRRDHLEQLLRDGGQTPVAAAAAYAVTGNLGSPDGITAAALLVERRCVTTYAALVAASVGPLRRTAIALLGDGAVGELAFGGRPRPLPGLTG